MSVVAHRQYLADKTPFGERFRPREISFTAATSVAKVVPGYVLPMVKQASLEKRYNPTSDEEVKRMPSFKESGLAFVESFTKALSIKTCTALLEEFVVAYLSPQVIRKLIKDLSKSATRKFIRTQSRSVAARLMLKTAMRANVLANVSIFLVEEACQVIDIVVRRHDKASKDVGDMKEETKDDSAVSTPSFLRITATNARQSCVAVVFSGVGAALGTLVRPGWGTVAGAMLGETITLRF